MTTQRANMPTARAGLSDSKVGTFTPELYDKAKKNKWAVLSLKQGWKRIVAFEQRPAYGQVPSPMDSYSTAPLARHLPRPKAVGR